MKKQIIIILILSIILVGTFSISYIDAGWFEDIFGKGDGANITDLNVLKDNQMKLSSIQVNESKALPKTYDSVKKEVTLKNKEGEDVVKFQVKENTYFCGIHCEAIIREHLDKDGRLIDQVDFKSLQNSVKNAQVQVATSEKNISIPLYSTYCPNPSYYTSGNKADFDKCYLIENGSYNQAVYTWDKLLDQDYKAGDYVINISGEKGFYDNVEWIPTVQNTYLDEFSSWNSSFSSQIITYYRFNNSNKDEVAGNNLSNIGTPAYNTFGILGQSFKGSSSDQNTFSMVPSQHPNGTGTMNMWLNRTSASSYDIIMGANAGTSYGDIYVNPDGSITWQMSASTKITKAGGFYGGNLSNWHMLTIVWNTSTVTTYFDGVLDTATVIQKYMNNSGNWTFGKDPGTYMPTMSIDELAFWNRTLSQSEVTSLYNGGAAMGYIGGDSTPPYFTTIPSNATLNYGTNLDVVFVGADETGFSRYRINWTNTFTINTTNGSLTNSSPLGGGNYTINVTINDTSNNLNSTLYHVQVLQGTPTIYTYVNNSRANLTITQGTSIWLNCTETVGDHPATLYNNYTQINNGFNMANYTTFNSVGLYWITCTVSDSQNYTTGDESWWVNVIADNYPQFTNPLTSYPSGSEYAYGKDWQFNITISNTNGSAGINWLGTNYSLSNISSSFYKDFISLPQFAGAVYYYWSYGNGASHYYNQSPTYGYTIVKNSSYVLGVSKTSPITYGAITDFAGTGCPGDIACNLNITNGVFGAGTIYANYSYNGNSNYVAASAVGSVIINQADPSPLLSISKTTPITYPTFTDAVGSGCPSQLTCSLSPANAIYGAGTTTFNYSTSSNTNYTAGSTTTTVTINKAGSKTSLTFDKTSPQNYLTSITPTCSLTIPAVGSVSLTNGTSGVPEVLGANTWSFNCSYAGNENYSQASNYSTFTINPIVPSGNLFTSLGSWIINASQTITIGVTESNTGDSDVTYVVYKNGLSVGTGETWTPPVGNYTYILNTTGGTNYTANASMDTKILVVNDNLPPNVTLISPINNNYTNNTTNNFTANLSDSAGLLLLCYQESANTTNQTGIDGNCGLNYTGTYSTVNGGAYNALGTGTSCPANMYDGLYTSLCARADGELYINYSKPSFSQGAIWQVTYQSIASTVGYKNFTITNGCYNYNNKSIQLKINTSQDGLNRNQYDYCYDGTWELLGSSGSGWQDEHAIYDEGIYWNMNPASGLKNATLNIYNQTSGNITNQTTTTFIGSVLDYIIGIPVTLFDGAYTWFYNVFDNSGNSANSQNFTLTIDTLNPGISFSTGTLPNDTYVNSTNVYVNVSVTEANEANITFSLYNLASGLGTPINQTILGAGNRTINWTNLPNTLYYYQVNITDKLNQKNATELRTITLDTINPTINNTSPTLPPGTYNYTAIWINVTANDTNLKNISVHLELVSGGTPYSDTQVVTVSTPQQSFYYNWTGLGQGIYNRYAWAYDKAGNVNYTTSETINIDNASPVMTYASPTPPEGYITTQTYFTINVTSLDANLANQTIYYWSSLSPTILTQNTTSAINSLYQSGLSDGTYYYNATATDSAGRTSWLSTRNITIQSGENISNCNVLSIPSQSYRILTNLASTTTCLEVTAPNVTINCQGHTIIVTGTDPAILATKTGLILINCSLSSSSGAGLKIKGNSPASVSVYNSTFFGSVYGIYVSPEGSLYADTVNITGNDVGIYLNNSDNKNTMKNLLMSANTQTLNITNSSYNSISNLTITSGGGTYLNRSTDNNFAGCTITPAGVMWTLTDYSINNALLSCNYDNTVSTESIDSTSQLIRNWPFAGTVQDSVKNKLQGAKINYIASHATNQFVNYSDGTNISYGTLSGFAYTNSPGIANADITQYMTMDNIRYNSTPYYFNATYSTFTPVSALLNITNYTTHTFTLSQEVKSTSLSRTAMWIILGIIFLIGIAASIGFFMVRMREGYSVVDIWKYFIILVIWLTIFTIIYFVLAWFIMGSFYPQV